MAGVYRTKAMDILNRELPPGVRISSNGDPRFEKLTGVSHATLLANWAVPATRKRTCCMDYVAHFCREMGISPNLGRFDLEEFLPTINKEHAWVRSIEGRPPQEGDILLHQGVHIDVCMGFEIIKGKKYLVRGAAGQGTPGKADVVARVVGTSEYDYRKLKGWVDIERFFGAAATPTVPGLRGWWKVWDGNTYYYYFGNEGFIHYMMKPPTNGPVYPLPRSSGTYTLDGDKLVITWNPLDGAPTVETFGVMANATRMNGMSNRYSPLVATKL